jgi:hypothetical protein
MATAKLADIQNDAGRFHRFAIILFRRLIGAHFRLQRGTILARGYEPVNSGCGITLR